WSVRSACAGASRPLLPALPPLPPGSPSLVQTQGSAATPHAAGPSPCQRRCLRAAGAQSCYRRPWQMFCYASWLILRAALAHHPSTCGYLASAALAAASISFFSSSGVSFGGSSAIVSLLILPVNLNGTW